MVLQDLAVEHSAADLSTCLINSCEDQSADYLTTATLHWQHSSNISLLRVNVTHTGGYAVWMDIGVSDAQISACHISDMGALTAKLLRPL